MDTRLVKRLSACAFLLLVAGCGLFRFDSRAPWRDEAEQKCLSSGQVQITPAIEASRELDGPGACGMLQPFRVSALAEGSVALKSKATLACPMIPVVDKWVEEVVQPAAKLYYGTRVAELNAGSYSCRNQNNTWFGDASEHAFGNGEGAEHPGHITDEHQQGQGDHERQHTRHHQLVPVVAVKI